jgi:hypothetical protein
MRVILMEIRGERARRSGQISLTEVISISIGVFEVSKRALGMSISLNSQKNNYKDIHQISFEKKFDTEKKSSKEESSLKKSSKNRNTLKKKNSKKDNKTLIKKKIDKEIQ